MFDRVLNTSLSIYPKQTMQSIICYSRQKQSPEVFCKQDVLKNFSKFTGKRLCQSLFFNKKRLWHRCFLVNFCKISKSNLLIEHLRATASDFDAVSLWWLHSRKFSANFFPVFSNFANAKYMKSDSLRLLFSSTQSKF